jgi:hypothetical protein
LDLNDAELPSVRADGAWTRWVYAFVKDPRSLLNRVTKRLRPGGAYVIHEYIDYSTWRLAPRLPQLEEYVQAVMQGWRADGGEPDIGLEIPSWLRELGYEIRALNLLIDIVPPSSPVWQWLSAFVDVGIRRLVDLGRMQEKRAEEILNEFRYRERDARSLVIAPTVLEIIAVLR